MPKIALDPNNNTWAKDTSRFGFQMLLKMGWSNGKGLGKNEDGQTEHVKVEKREENIGLGAEVKNFSWTVHRDNFDDMLKRLNDNNDWATPIPESDLVDTVSDTASSEGPESPRGAKRPLSETTVTQAPAMKKQKKSKGDRKAELAAAGHTKAEVKAMMLREKQARKARREQLRAQKKALGLK
mmetsp:Transcript_127492/g.179948  ORF Transcript_127492/g.179948 Transcript_127492/m.179948 type:complete len:183 (+) Transcript_127492:104-652(+)